jgi:hypothetical protein
MIEDKWLPVTHDTVMPDGGAVPEEVRPKPGKRQYIDLTKYEDDVAEKTLLSAPDAVEYPAGRYRCVSSWVNCRETPDTSSPIVGRFVQDQTLSLVSVKVFGTAVRGQAERGGWISIMASGGKTLFERIGDLDVQSLTGSYRVSGRAGAPFFIGRLGDIPKPITSTGRTDAGDEFCVCEVAMSRDGSLLGKNADTASWVLLYSLAEGLLCEMIVQGYNEKPRRPIKGQTGHQMMLVSDMVLLWDEAFRKHLEVYASNEAKLKTDFGVAFRRLTELGCPWSRDFNSSGKVGREVSAGLASLCPLGFVK